MKVYIVGHKGWIGQMYIEEFKKNNIEFTFSNTLRGESEEIKKDILQSGATHILCTMGRTHGTYNGIKYDTIDYLQHDDTMYENINDNLYVPLNLALFAKQESLHFTYMGTGCIFSYDTSSCLDTDKYGLGTRILPGFKESDSMNFTGSNYSIVKGFTDMLMRNSDALVLRIRMPITSQSGPRNFITKILKYKKICSMPNSMTVLDSMIPLSIQMMINKEIGCYNFTNPGYIDHNTILSMYRDKIDKNFTWENFTIEEQNNILKSKRSNNVLDTTKLTKKYNIDSIEEGITNCFNNWKE